MLVFFSCSTEKNKFVNRTFHNTTARFNGYFNANELIKESLIDFHIANKDDYSKILPVFIIPTEETSKSLYAPMDKAIQKTSMVIKKHSMPNPEKRTNKNEEWCKWIDNNWLVMGKAYYYKREFSDAKTRFEYVFKNYQADPIKYEAFLWQAKTYLEMGDNVNTVVYLEKLQDKMESQTDKAKVAAKKKEEAKKKKSKSKYKTTNLDPDMDPALYADITMTWADFYLRKKDYTKAEDKIKKSILLVKNKKERARLHFILGQLYQLKGDLGSANVQYARVDKLNPEYEMEFYSRIFRALNYEGGNSAALKRQLLKMAKDEKNIDYLDQIYYALGEIELKEKNEPSGIGYLKKSVQVSTKNARQKGLSYKRLGDIYYDKKKFIRSKSYYDSTMLNLPKEYEQYAAVKEKSESLKDLVTHLIVIEREDSLMRLVNMPDKELDKYLDNIIAKQEEEEERKKQIELNLADKAPDNQGTATSSTAWYFYNQPMMSKGVVDFKKLYGTRKLEDDWRRTDKSSSGDIEENPDETKVETKDKNDPLAKREALKKKLPMSDREKQASDKALNTALFKAGSIYKERLNENALSAECFERLIKKFPETENALPSHFSLYLIYQTSNATKSDEHKNYILTNHPESEYAKIIKNPNFKKEESLTREAEEKRYEEAYNTYRRKNFETAIRACNEVIEKEPNNHFLSRYYYLKALAYGEMQQYDNFEKALSETATKFPKDEIGIAASDMLNLLRNRNSILNASSGKSTYIYEDQVEHFFVLVFTSSMGSVNDAKAKISNFNSASFSLVELKITNNFLNTDDQVVLVKKFENKEKAMNYYIAFKNTDMLKGLSDKADYFVITNKNYASFYVEKNVEAYKKFFNDNYLK